jgi:hypothetical protein
LKAVPPTASKFLIENVGTYGEHSNDKRT